MGFLAPWFLAGAAALGVPVFVHLLRKHVAIPKPVSSLMFFERGIQSSTRHRQLRYLLLFALRFALVLLVVLAFANPFLRRPNASAKDRLLVVVLDRSFSMRAGTRFAEAKQQALAVLAAKAPQQKAQVMALGGQLEILTQPGADPAPLRAALASIEPGDGRGDFGELGRGIRVLAENTRGPMEVHLFSDMQRSAIPANFADMVLGDAKLVLHPVVKQDAPANWTVESVQAPTDLADPKDPKRSRVQAVIAGMNTPAAEKNVALVVNGKTIATHKVQVPANGHATVEFAPLEVGYGFNRCEVRIDGGDAFPADDASVFAVRRADPERVLFVHSARDTRSAVYFTTALNAAAPASYVVQQAVEEQTADIDPTKFAFVVLSDAEFLPSIFEHALLQYAAKGGSVFTALGAGAERRTRIPLWDAEVKDVKHYLGPEGAATVGEADFTYPALAEAQAGRDQGGWAGVKFFQAAQMDGGGARVAARLNDGTPLLMEKPVGEGRLMLMTSGMENLTNDLPLHPVFVAFVDRSARYLSGDARLSGARVVDSFVPLRAATEPVGATANVEVIDPDGRRPLSLSEARTAQTLRLQRAGFYQIRLADGHEAVVGVNPDRRESDLTPMPEDVQRLWSGSAGNGNEGVAAQAVGTAVGDSVAQTQRVSLWWWVMLLACLVALAETALASGYMGTQREEA